MVLNRRRALIEQATQGGYVQDGLELFLDGLNRGGTSGKWFDLTNNYEFTIENCTENNGFVYINGNNGSQIYNNDLSLDIKTVEFVIKNIVKITVDC